MLRKNCYTRICVSHSPFQNISRGIRGGLRYIEDDLCALCVRARCRPWKTCAALRQLCQKFSRINRPAGEFANEPKRSLPQTSMAPIQQRSHGDVTNCPPIGEGRIETWRVYLSKCRKLPTTSNNFFRERAKREAAKKSYEKKVTLLIRVIQFFFYCIIAINYKL